MSVAFQGVIETATGDLLRAGYCDFTNDGAFDPARETIVNSLPPGAKVRGQPGTDLFSRWNGQAWTEVVQSNGAEAAERRINSDRVLKAMVGTLADALGLGEQELINQIKIKARRS